MHKRTNEGGSVVTFVIVGVVLAAVVAGGVYLVNQRGEDKRTNQPTPTSQNQPSGQTSNPTTTPSPTQSQPKPNTGSQAPKTGQSTTPTTGVNSSASTSDGHLPTTGPVDNGIRLIALSILIGTATAYIQSRVRKGHPSTL
jgi:cytoskeletal protein RodZ